MPQNPEDLLQAGNTIQLSPTGFSMYPLFDPRKGDQAIIAPLGNAKPKRGDVVLYRRDGNPEEVDAQGNQRGILVIHRIARVEGESCYCVGDNQVQVEGPLRPDQLRGILTGRVRGTKCLSVESLSYQLLTGLWLFLLPCRPIAFRLAGGLRKLFRRNS